MASDEWVENPEDVKPEPEEPELGPTGKPADEKLQEDDEGELQFAVGTTQSGEVFLDFGHKVKWIAMEPSEAIELAKMIAANAQKGARVRAILKKKMEGAGLVGADGKPIIKA